MSAYPPIAPVNGISQGLFPFDIERQFFKEFIQITPLRKFMGKSKRMPISIHDARAGDGWQYRIPRLKALVSNPIYGFNQVSGTGQYRTVQYDVVTMQKISQAVAEQGMDLIKLGTPVDVTGQTREDLMNLCERQLNKDIFDCMMTGKYTIATQLPSYDRAIMSGTAVARGAWNGYAGLTTAVNAMVGPPTYAGAGLNGAHLLNLKNMAILGGATPKAEAAIEPAYIKTRNGWAMNDYIYFGNPVAINQLLLDPFFSESTTKRGVIVDPLNQAQMLYGAEYIGLFQGIHIYSCKDLADYTFASQADADKRIAWGLLIGAGAVSLGWHRTPWLAMEQNTLDTVREFATHEIRGQKCLEFPAINTDTLTAAAPINKNVEQGIIHSFTRIA